MKCMQCNGVLNITDCLDVEVECGAGESCFLERIITSSNQIVFNSGCRSNRVCMITEQMTGGLGKRDLVRKNRDIVTCSDIVMQRRMTMDRVTQDYVVKTRQ